MLRYLTAGESHGEALVAILEGVPAGLKVDAALINKELKRRQSGFGRSKRMQIESDKVHILSGLKNGIALGSPIVLLVKNKDFKINKLPKVFFPRPGHADLAGALKYGFTDARSVLERASARGTAVNVALGAVCKILLRQFGIEISSCVLSVGGEKTKEGIEEKIRQAINKKDTVGGIFEVVAEGVPAGLGSYVQPDKRLGARIAAEIMGIPGIKSIEIGLGLGFAYQFGSEVHDEIYYSIDKGFYRFTNNAGGIEGGISNGENIVIRACMKPIATLMNPLKSVNIISKKTGTASVERSDTCVVSAAGVVAESACAYVLAAVFLEKFGSDSLVDIKESYRNYLERIRSR